MTTKDDDAKCERCQKKPAEPLHPCPFAEDIHNDPEPHCTCCDDCRHECAMDI